MVTHRRHLGVRDLIIGYGWCSHADGRVAGRRRRHPGDGVIEGIRRLSSGPGTRTRRDVPVPAARPGSRHFAFGTDVAGIGFGFFSYVRDGHDRRRLRLRVHPVAAYYWRASQHRGTRRRYRDRPGDHRHPDGRFTRGSTSWDHAAYSPGWNSTITCGSRDPGPGANSSGCMLKIPPLKTHRRGSGFATGGIKGLTAALRWPA